MHVQVIDDGATWDRLIATHPQAHPLQTWGWGEVKQATGWGAWRVAVLEDAAVRAAAQVLIRRLPRLPFCMFYVPRGPVVSPDDLPALQLLMDAIRAEGQRRGAIFVKVDPAWPADTSHPLTEARFTPSQEPIQVTDTYTIDLTRSTEDILAAMRSKTRQYIRKAEREGAVIERDTTGSTLEICYRMYQETARRAHFGLHPREYYDAIFQHYDPRRQYLYLARQDDQPVAFLWMACFGRFAVELYGGVADAGQESRANYLLKWHAIQAMQAEGYTLYDLNGRVNEGISQFKEGFGPDKTSWIGPYDRVFRPLLYRGWTRTLPLARRVMARNAAE